MKNLLKFKIQNLCLLTLVITSCFISGCGFHLAKPMSAKNPLYIQIESSQPRSRFTQILVSTLKENNIIPQEQKNNKTKYFILVGPLENTTSIKSISGNALAGTYTESYQVTVTFVPMNTKNKKTDLESEITRTFVYQNNYQSNASLALSANSQKEQIQEQAYPGLSSQIINAIVDLSEK